MPINRQDYEQWLLLYVDNELTAEQCAEVEAFLAANPDLAVELEILLGSRLPSEPLQFPGKSALLKQATPEADYETQLLLHLDHELPADASKELFTQVAASAELSASWEILQQTKLQPETIPYPDKAELYRHSHRRVVPMRWWQLAAAAMLIGAGLWGTVQWMNGEQGIVNREGGTANEVVSSRQPSTINRQPKEQGMENREQRTGNEVASSGQQPSANRQSKEQGMVNREEGTKNEVAATNLQPSTFNLQPSEQGITNREERTANEVAASRQQPSANRQPDEQGMVNREEATMNNVAASKLQPSTFILQPSSGGGSSDVVYASFDEDDEEDRPRKSKVGAFFKRAKRVFERKTKIKTGNSEDVRIANMTFAMH